MNNPPLARRLGDTIHVSPLLHKVVQLSGCPGIASENGCSNVPSAGEPATTSGIFPAPPPDHTEVSNEEIAVALCLGQHPYNSTFIRAAAQLLSSPRTDAPGLARLAVMERVEPVLLYIATVAARIAPEAQPWSYLLRHLPQRLACPPDALPHWSRFVTNRHHFFGGGPDIKWLWRREPAK